MSDWNELILQKKILNDLHYFLVRLFNHAYVIL